jgi:hypothetical protein
MMGRRKPRKKKNVRIIRFEDRGLGLRLYICDRGESLYYTYG